MPKQAKQTDSSHETAESARQFDLALEQLSQSINWKDVDQIAPSSPQTVYTSSVALWLLTVQRLKKGCSLQAAVDHLLNANPDFLPNNKRVREGTLASNTAAYSNSRRRLTMEAVMWFTDTVQKSLIEASPPTFQGRRVFLIDGTTLTLRPDNIDLHEAYPPATNQHGSSPWPLVHLVVAHELASGIALPPEVGAKEGPQAVSETSLISDHMQRILSGSVVMADANYGILRVAHAADQADHDFVFRMTSQRFQSLQKKASLVEETAAWKRYEHVWRPTKKERANNPQFSDETAIAVHLYEIELPQGKKLYLVTSLSTDGDALLELYRYRWNVEVDIRNFKVVLDVENIRATSQEIFLKELMTSVVAYNLMAQFRREAAKIANTSPRQMSFTRIWSVFRTFLLENMFSESVQWREQYEIALRLASQRKLPNRPGRSYEREAYQRRPKSNAFKKRKSPRNP